MNSVTRNIGFKQSKAYSVSGFYSFPSNPLYLYLFLILASIFVGFMLSTILQIVKEPASFEV